MTRNFGCYDNMTIVSQLTSWLNMQPTWTLLDSNLTSRWLPWPFDQQPGYGQEKNIGSNLKKSSRTLVIWLRKKNSLHPSLLVGLLKATQHLKIKGELNPENNMA